MKIFFYEKKKFSQELSQYMHTVYPNIQINRLCFAHIIFTWMLKNSTSTIKFFKKVSLLANNSFQLEHIFPDIPLVPSIIVLMCLQNCRPIVKAGCGWLCQRRNLPSARIFKLDSPKTLPLTNPTCHNGPRLFGEVDLTSQCNNARTLKVIHYYRRVNCTGLCKMEDCAVHCRDCISS